jgi:uncharacterized membrane protein YphA (DoxX/SURF4 family)
MAQDASPRARWRLAAPWATTAARVALAAILGYAGLIKIGDTGAAVRAVRAYEILPEGWPLQIWAFGQPFLELALALLLLVGLASRLAAIAASVLLVIFIAGIVSVWVRGLSIDCGCFGGGGAVDPSQTDYPRKIAEDVGFLALALWIAVFPRSAYSVDGYLIEGTGAADEADAGDGAGEPDEAHEPAEAGSAGHRRSDGDSAEHAALSGTAGSPGMTGGTAGTAPGGPGDGDNRSGGDRQRKDA